MWKKWFPYLEELLLKERIRSPREQILSFMSKGTQLKRIIASSSSLPLIRVVFQRSGYAIAVHNNPRLHFTFAVHRLFDIVELLSEQIYGNTSFDDTSMKFTPYVLYMTHIQKRFLAASNLAIFKMAAKKKMADTSHEDVYSKINMSQFLFIIEHKNNRLGIKLKLNHCSLI